MLGNSKRKNQESLRLASLANMMRNFFGTICARLIGGEGEGEGEAAFFSAKRWDRRSRTDLIESATPCHDAQVVGPYRDSNPLHLTILAAMSEDYTTAPQHLHLAGHP